MNPKRSLTWLVYLALIAAGFLVIAVNRLSAGYLIEVDVQRRVQQEMRLGIATCQHLLGQTEAFLACYRQSNAREFSRVLSDAFVFCGLGGQVNDEISRGACQAIDAGQVNWIPSQEENGFSASFQRQAAWSRPWTGWHLGTNSIGPSVLLSKKAIDGFLGELWSYRNRHLVYVLPLIFTLLVFMAVWTIGIVMSPIRDLEKSLMKMTADNLNPDEGLYSRFKEFDGLTRIYLDLRYRLDESFRKARNFTSYASHELKTPLTILRGNAERLIAELPTGSPAQLQVSNMAGEVERLIDITNKLLTLSRADSKLLLTQRQDFNLSNFLEQFVEDAAAFGNDIHIESEIASDVIWHCDPVLVRQLLNNLFSNAMKYNVTTGHIRLELQHVGENLTLSVTNSTGDLSAEMVEHAFDRFYRGDSAHNRGVDGLGLGLSISLEIARAHKGTLEFLVPERNIATLMLRVPLHF